MIQQSFSPLPDHYLVGKGLDHQPASTWMENMLPDNLTSQKHRQLIIRTKFKKIKASLNKVNTDPMKYIRKAFLRWLPAGGKPTFKLRTVTISDVHTMIKALKISHAYGHDEVDSSIIKLAAPVLAPVITHIVNLSLGTSTFPQKWKLARVLPLLKSSDADKHTHGSFRPIAQLSVILKLVEHTVQTQLLHYLEDTKQISPDHHAYRIKCSTTSVLIQIMDTIAEGVEENEITATLSVDQSRLFRGFDEDYVNDEENALTASFS